VHHFVVAMSCSQIAFLLGWATASAVTAVAADTPAAARGDASVRPPILVMPTPSTPTPAPAMSASHAVSPDTAAKLAVVAPKFDSVPPKPETTDAPAKPTEPIDLREIDKPRNTIIRLPNYLVQEEKPSVIKEREVLTPKARLENAYKKHPGLHVGSLPFLSNDGIALFMQQEDERLERKSEFEDLVSLLRFGDPAHAAVKSEVEQAFMREARFGH
jgi:hypothetical protein